MVADNEAKFWADPNYTGESVTVTAGTTKDLVGTSMNDKISSFIIGRNVRVRLCYHGDCSHPGNDYPGFNEIVGPYSITVDYI